MAAEIFYIEHDFPLQKDLVRISKLLKNGASCIFPTDTVYAIGCMADQKNTIDKIVNIVSKADKKMKMSILCRDIKMSSDYTLPLSTEAFTTIKQNSPGPVTFILNANNKLSKLFKSSKREIGLRIPENAVIQGIIDELNTAIISTSLKSENDTLEDLNDPEFIIQKFRNDVDIIIASDKIIPSESAIIDCTTNEIILIREGSISIIGEY